MSHVGGGGTGAGPGGGTQLAPTRFQFELSSTQLMAVPLATRVPWCVSPKSNVIERPAPAVTEIVAVCHSPVDKPQSECGGDETIEEGL